MGMLTRKRIRHLHASAVHMQRLVRGGQGRARARALHFRVTRAAVIIQRCVRMILGRRIAEAKRLELRQKEQLLKTTILIQSLYRAWKGRELAAKRKEDAVVERAEFSAARSIQSMYRHGQAVRRVDRVRQDRLEE